MYAGKHWQDRTPARHRGAELQTCPRKRVRRERKQFHIYRAYRKFATIPGFHGEGKYLAWLPIPRYIVSCETSGFHGAGRWHAHNSSGARGPAQLLGWGEPYPANTPAKKLVYWRTAKRVWHIQGSGAWVCA